MGSRKQQAGIEGAAAALRELLADVEQSVLSLTEAVEKDEEQDQDDTREQLAELQGQASALVDRANELLERARAVAERTEERGQKRTEASAEFASAFEDLVNGLGSAAETLDPDNWDWGEEEADGG